MTQQQAQTQVHYAIPHSLLQEMADYITNSPCPTMPVSVPITLLSKLQALQSIQIGPDPNAKPISEIIEEGKRALEHSKAE